METFNLARVGQLLWRRLILHTRGALIMVAPLLALLLVAVITTIGDHQSSADEDETLFMIFYYFLIVVYGYLATSASLPEMRDAEGRQSYLTLPASNLEKWFTTWLFTGPLFVLVASLVYSLLTVLVNVILVALQLPPNIPFELFSEATGETIKMYLLLVHPLALLGAIMFNRWAFAKTIGILLLVAFGVAILAFITFRIVYADAFSGLLSFDGEQLEANMNFSFGPGESELYTVLLAIGLLAASYFKFKEKEA